MGVAILRPPPHSCLCVCKLTFVWFSVDKCTYVTGEEVTWVDQSRGTVHAVFEKQGLLGVWILSDRLV